MTGTGPASRSTLHPTLAGNPSDRLAGTAVDQCFGIFLGQWGTGVILNLWPASATGYDPRGYSYALGGLWIIQLLGLLWLWRGRTLLEKDVAVAGV